MRWRDPLLSALRVPHTPAPPPGSPPRVFRAAPNFYKLRLLRYVATQSLAVVGLVWGIWFIRWIDATRAPQFVVWLLEIGEVFGILALVFQALVGWAMVRLDFELRWYMLSDRAIRIREGIVTVREKTVALANVQNIAVRQGPLQRFLGIADVEVNTAGGGGRSSDEQKSAAHDQMHVAYFRGVDNAEEIRDLVREGVRRQRDAGLGDPDEHHDDVPAAIAELLHEARALGRWGQT
jgi:uncharacterized membrane protein YdbT with pleckstrin-like domain